MSGNAAAMRKETAWLGLEAPRYTSYPSAHHFSSEVNEHHHREWLGAVGAETTISAYVHIPFCRELCWFCGCHTKASRRYDSIARYVKVLLKEIEMLKQCTGGKGKLVNIHFGGGSPSLLEADDLSAILDALSRAFTISPPGELAIELDPRTTSPENISLYAGVGFNRVSIGIQDFNEEVQRAINRVQPYPMVATMVQQLRKAGIDAMNCDLIYGLPRQTPNRFHDTLKKTLALDPSRIALFSYAHMPHIKKHQRLIDSAWLPPENEKLALYAMAREVLEGAGYVPIGIDHFAKPNDALAVAAKQRTLRRNFQGYVTDATDILIGIGSSAISQFPGGYVQNNASTQEYCKRAEQGNLAAARGWQFAGDDLIRKCVIDELMCFMDVDLAAIRQAFHLKQSYFQPELELLHDDPYRDIVAADKEHIRIATPHRMAVRAVAAAFDHHRAAAGRYSKVA